MPFLTQSVVLAGGFHVIPLTALLVVMGFFVGASVGSFVELAAWRLPRGESVVQPRSYCPGCRTTLAWYDNVPCVSWFVLRGKCRSCGWAIPARHVVVEALAGVAGVLAVAVTVAVARRALS